MLSHGNRRKLRSHDMVQYTACKCAARPAGCKASCITALFTQSSYTGKQDYTHHTRSIFLIHRLLSTACIPYHNNENSNLVHFKRKNIIWQFDIFFKSRWQLNLEFGSGNFFTLCGISRGILGYFPHLQVYQFHFRSKIRIW